MKRRLFKLAMFLILAAVVNVAVAWGCALWAGTNPELSFGSNHADLGYGPVPVSKQVWKFHISHLAIERNSVREFFTSGFDFGYETYRINSLEYLASPKHQLITNGLHVGWPASSLAAFNTIYYGEDSRILEVWESGILFVVGESRWIPIRPIWPGFAINTVLYALILWLLTLGPFAARRLIRHKRGHCIKCGYDLRGKYESGCSECGLGRES